MRRLGRRRLGRRRLGMRRLGRRRLGRRRLAKGWLVRRRVADRLLYRGLPVEGVPCLRMRGVAERYLTDTLDHLQERSHSIADRLKLVS